MDLGFETIGNACLIFHDRGPVLATDPWLFGPAYFGSWILSHEVPGEQQAHVRACKYLWISHGHPDHLSLPSLERLRDKQILLADHHGGRIARELRGLGFQVTVLQDGVWTELSPRLRIATIANFNQDAVLLADLDGHLIVDANDAGDRGASCFLARELPRFRKRRFLACLTGYGDADMINFFDEQGRRILPPAAAKPPVGPQIAQKLEQYGIDTFLPSSSMHQYQREDSVWANDYITPVDAHAQGFASPPARIAPAFVAYDLQRDAWDEIRPRPNLVVPQPPSVFGDDWTTPLEPGEVDTLRRYLQRVQHLRHSLGFVNFRVGGRDHFVDINREHARGFTFATCRQSLLQAVEWQAFDDLLIGNFTRVIAHGDFGGRVGNATLYPEFAPFVTKFGDNGLAWSPAELRTYVAEYLRRGFTSFDLDPADQAVGRELQRYRQAARGL
jgi:L-ascorbate metabolism protein UlaG (beta-lactamase superfamily)